MIATVKERLQRALHWTLIVSFATVVAAMLANWQYIFWTSVAIFSGAAIALVTPPLLGRTKRSREATEWSEDDSGGECGWPDDTYATPPGVPS